MDNAARITEEELKSLTDIQAKSRELTFAFGQLHLRMLGLNSMQADLTATEKKLAEALNALSTEEAQVAKVLEEKYGKMQLNINDGTYTLL